MRVSGVSPVARGKGGADDEKKSGIARRSGGRLGHHEVPFADSHSPGVGVGDRLGHDCLGVEARGRPLRSRQSIQAMRPVKNERD